MLGKLQLKIMLVVRTEYEVRNEHVCAISWKKWYWVSSTCKDLMKMMTSASPQLIFRYKERSSKTARYWKTIDKHRYRKNIDKLRNCLLLKNI